MNYKLIFILILIINCQISFVNCFAQIDNTIDSLKAAVIVAKHDTTRIKTYIEIGDFYEYKSLDSAIYYYEKAQNLAKINSNKHPRFNSLQAVALRYLGIAEYNMGIYDKALEYLFKSVKIFEELLIQAKHNKNTDKIWEQTLKISKCFNDIGNVYCKQGTYDKSLSFYLKSLKICEEMLDDAKRSRNTNKIQEQKKNISKCYISIGNVHYFQGSYDKAINYYLKSLTIFEELLNMANQNKNINKIREQKQGISVCYNNIGNIYGDMGNSDKVYPVKRDRWFYRAIEYYLKSLKIIKELGDKNGISKCYNNLGSTYKELKNYGTALNYFLKSLKIKEELGDKNGTSTIWGNLADLHINIAVSCKDTQLRISHYREAVSYGLKSLKLAEEINAQYLINAEAAQLQKAFTALGNTANALKYAQIVISTKESMFNEEKTKSLAEMETKYQTEKKQLEIEKLEKQKALDKETIARKNAETKKQLIVIYSFVTGFLIILIFSIIILRLFIDKKRANVIILTKNSELKQANEEISTQRDLVVLQKKHIEVIHEEVTSSIRYAQRIQRAVITASEQMNEILGEHFVIFKPRDIVSGDFYWVTKVKKWLIFCVADCTGHGVPGAFMSMLGISFLNEIVRKKEVTNAADVLNYLRNNVVASLKQENMNSEQPVTKERVMDGMDIVLCVLDTETLKMQFAGANNSVYIITNKQVTNNKQLIELKGDKMPVSIYPRMEPFKYQQYQMQKDDLIYLFSDGFADQFGGSKGKKFQYKQLKEVLTANCYQPLSEQKAILEKIFDQWKENCSQVDDVTIMGIKITT